MSAKGGDKVAKRSGQRWRRCRRKGRPRTYCCLGTAVPRSRPPGARTPGSGPAQAATPLRRRGGGGRARGCGLGRQGAVRRSLPHCPSGRLFRTKGRRGAARKPDHRARCAARAAREGRPSVTAAGRRAGPRGTAVREAMACAPRGRGETHIPRPGASSGLAARRPATGVRSALCRPPGRGACAGCSSSGWARGRHVRLARLCQSSSPLPTTPGGRKEEDRRQKLVYLLFSS